MKYVLIIVSLVIMISSFPAAAVADDWDEYLAYGSRYYVIDDKEFDTITCAVELPSLTDQIEQLRKQLQPLEGNVELVTKMDNFSLRYSKDSGLEIIRPELDVRLVSEEGLPDPDKIKRAIRIIKSGFEQILEGLDMEMETVFDIYESPHREDYEDVKVTETDGRITATYRLKDTAVTEVFSGDVLEVRAVTGGGEAAMRAKFEKTEGNKLLVNNLTTELHHEGGAVSSDVSLTFQKVGTVIFPERIMTKSTLEAQSVRQEGKFEIYLKDCKAK
jgi:hypothetical protein